MPAEKCDIHLTTPYVGDTVWWWAKGKVSEPPRAAIVTWISSPGVLHLNVFQPIPGNPLIVRENVRHKDDPRHTTPETEHDAQAALQNGVWDYRSCDAKRAYIYDHYARHLEKQAERNRQREETIRKGREAHEAKLAAKQQAVGAK